MESNVQTDFSVNEKYEIPRLRHIMCFTGNHEDYIERFAKSFHETLKKQHKKRNIAYCDPFSQWKNDVLIAENSPDLEKLNDSFNIDPIYPLRLAVRRLPQNTKILIVCRIFSMECIIFLKDMFQLDPYVIDIKCEQKKFLAGRPYWHPIRSTLRLNIINEDDLWILKSYMLTSLLDLLDLKEIHKDIPDEEKADDTGPDYNRLAVMAPSIFDGIMKKVYRGDKTARYIPIPKPEPSDSEDAE